ncbi:MAG: hypothetical protein AAGA00_05195 [Pseudomonadota bacterium]
MHLVFPGLLLVLPVVLLAVLLLNLPTLYREEGLPLFPALLAGEACLIGLAVCLYGLYVIVLEPRRNRNRLRREQASSASAPWLGNKQWASKRITHTRQGKVLFLWLFAVNWWAAIWFVAADRGEQILQQSWAIILLCLVFVLIGVVTLWSAVKNSISWARFGTTTMFIDTLPGQPGQTFKGYIELGFRPEAKVHTRLQLSGFVRRWKQRIATEGARRVNDRHDEAPFFNYEQRIKAAAIRETGRCFRVPVNLEIPNDARSSGPSGDGSEVIWKLAILSKSPDGSSFSADFEIPVFDATAVHGSGNADERSAE